MHVVVDLVVTTIQCIAAALTTYLFLLWGYRIVLHPLKDYPGPLLAKISDAYAGYFALHQNLHLRTWRNHVKYGPVIRQGPQRLIFNTSSALEEIYLLNENVCKSHVYDLTRQANSTVNVFNAIDKDIHRRKRRLVSYAISDRAMKSFQPTMAQQIDIFLGRILAAKQSPINMTAYVKQLSLDIVALVGFGYHMQTQTLEKDRWISQGVVKGNYRINSYMNFPGLRHARIDLLMGILAGKARLKYGELIGRMVTERLSQDKDAKPDLFAAVTKEENLQGEKPLSQSEIFQEAVFFIPAGADTSAAAMCALLFYLSRNQDAYHRLSHEIRSTFTTTAQITGGPQLAGCKYLRACIDEALRLSPPVGGTLWREHDDEKPFVVDGHTIPRDTQVGVCTYALHHNPQYFPEPFSFKPERWLAADTEVQRRAFAPFSLGPRSCPGKAMAYLEMSLTISKLLWYFDFERAPGALGQVGVRKAQATKGGPVADEYELHDVFVSTHDGPNLVFRPRREVSGEITPV